MLACVLVFPERAVAEQQLPFSMKTPNAETRAAMKEADDIADAHQARFSNAAELLADLEKNSGR